MLAVANQFGSLMVNLHQDNEVTRRGRQDHADLDLLFASARFSGSAAASAFRAQGKTSRIYSASKALQDGVAGVEIETEQSANPSLAKDRALFSGYTLDPERRYSWNSGKTYEADENATSITTADQLNAKLKSRREGIKEEAATSRAENFQESADLRSREDVLMSRYLEGKSLTPPEQKELNIIRRAHATIQRDDSIARELQNTGVGRIIRPGSRNPSEQRLNERKEFRTEQMEPYSVTENLNNYALFA